MVLLSVGSFLLSVRIVLCFNFRVFQLNRGVNRKTSPHVAAYIKLLYEFWGTTVQ